MNAPEPMPVYSVVIPFFNEEGAVTELLAELREAMDKLGSPYEVILVDDGSSDGTLGKLSAAVTGWPAGRCVPLIRNQGQAAALLRGFAEARGRWIITLDGDGQNSPADISALLTAANDCDMVVGIRVARRDGWLRRVMSRLANRVRGKLLRDGLQDSGCALKVFRSEVVASFWPIRSLYSFMPAFAVAAGWRLKEIPVRHRERETGASKYGFGTFAWRPLVDLLALWWLLWRRRVKTTTDAPSALGDR
ncbi:MAG: glycosyltransferase family 2 protein [Opitutaceae bacterium]